MSFRSLFQSLKPQGTHTFIQRPRRGPSASPTGCKPAYN